MDTVQKKYDWPIDAVVDVIGGKWKPLIMYVLSDDTLRFSELLEKVKPRITQRMLTKQLRQLEEDGMVTRKVYAQVPPRVEYSLTKEGRSLMPILDQLCLWGCEHMRDKIKYLCD
ncbi:MAG: helix-turn-helix domain-containing protein [Candidatus Bathyarchaeota archaeon]|nr:helix-turn-helix domain-containing protein [Candidatus Bathyarchaeota archaeon]